MVMKRVQRGVGAAVVSSLESEEVGSQTPVCKRTRASRSPSPLILRNKFKTAVVYLL
jgi:hypothetical protein